MEVSQSQSYLSVLTDTCSGGDGSGDNSPERPCVVSPRYNDALLRRSNTMPYPTYAGWSHQNGGEDVVMPCDPRVPRCYGLPLSWYEQRRCVGVSFMILSRNEEVSLQQNITSIIDALSEDDTPSARQVPVEIVVIDNGSSDGTLRMIQDIAMTRGIPLQCRVGARRVSPRSMTQYHIPHQNKTAIEIHQILLCIQVILVQQMVTPVH